MLYLHVSLLDVCLLLDGSVNISGCSHLCFLPRLGGENNWSARGVVFRAAVSGHQGLFNMAETQQEGE